MAHYKIVSRFDANKVLYEGEAKSLKDLVASAIKMGSDLRGSDLSRSNLRRSDLRDSDLSDSNLSGSNLSGSNLRRSNLSGSNLSGSNLSGSDLSGSNLSGSDLRGSDLSGSDLSGSNLRDSDLSDSDLSDSDLSGSDLSDSDLRRSDLSGSNLRDSDLSGSNLSHIKADFFMTLLHAIPAERSYLRTALIEGRVDGSQYEGECACLKGTLENACHRTPEVIGLKHEISEPAESFFLGISKGDTPETNQISKIVLGWLDEYELLVLESIPQPQRRKDTHA